MITERTLDGDCFEFVAEFRGRAVRVDVGDLFRFDLRVTQCIAHHPEGAFAIFRRHGLLAITIPSLLPPPVPFKVFVLAAGASGMKRMDFLIAITVGRSIRYFGEAILAAWFGAAALSRIEAFVQENRALSVAIVVLILVAIGGWVWWSRRPARFDSNTGTPL